MGLLFKIALRNLTRQKRRTILTGLVMFGGVLLLSISLGIQEGGYGYVIDAFTGARTGHVQIHAQGYLDKPSLYTNLKDPASLLKKLAENRSVISYSPRVYGAALAFEDKKTTGAQIFGIDLAQEDQLSKIGSRLAEGRFFREANEVVIGGGLQAILHSKLGDQLILVSQGADGSIANDLYKIVGVLKGGVDAQNRMDCVMSLGDAQAFLGLGQRIHEVSLKAESYQKSRQLAAQLSAEFAGQGFEIDPWQVVEKEFYEFMLLDKQGGWVTYFVIILLVTLEVLNTVLMTILEKTREFGLMKALGTRPAQVFWLILIETGLLATLASGLGILVAWPLNDYFASHGIPLPVAYDLGGVVMDKLVSEVSFLSMGLPFLVSFFTALLVAMIPAYRASMIVPVKALKSY